MAHFAELNSSNEVLQVIVISNTDVDANGGDESAEAETFVATIVPYGTGGAAWKQTSYNNNFRKQYAGIGMIYDPVKDKFLSPQPFASWALDASDDWQAPVTYPTDTGTEESPKFISWDEDNLKWTATDHSDPVNNFNWDASALAWVSA
jgi:hypothetical protein